MSSETPVGESGGVVGNSTTYRTLSMTPAACKPRRSRPREGECQKHVTCKKAASTPIMSANALETLGAYADAGLDLLKVPSMDMEPLISAPALTASLMAAVVRVLDVVTRGVDGDCVTI